jgi:hypothetical protein
VKPLPDTVPTVPARPNAGKIDIEDWDALPKAQRKPLLFLMYRTPLAIAGDEVVPTLLIT